MRDAYPINEALLNLIWVVAEQLQTVRLCRKPTPQQLLELHENEGRLIVALQKERCSPEINEQRDEAIIGFMVEQRRTRERYERLYGEPPTRAN